MIYNADSVRENRLNENEPWNTFSNAEIVDVFNNWMEVMGIWKELSVIKLVNKSTPLQSTFAVVNSIDVDKITKSPIENNKYLSTYEFITEDFEPRISDFLSEIDKYEKVSHIWPFLQSVAQVLTESIETNTPFPDQVTVLKEVFTWFFPENWNDTMNYWDGSDYSTHIETYAKYLERWWDERLIEFIEKFIIEHDIKST